MRIEVLVPMLKCVGSSNLKLMIMLFTVTTIRINHQTRVFENTEVNQFMLLGDLEKELIGNGCDFAQFERAIAMVKGDTITLEATIYEGIKKGTRFSYIHKVS